jgi:lipopolysaccharide export system permease protein
MMISTLGRYFGLRFLGAVVAVFTSVFLLMIMIDYIEMMRRYSDVPTASTWEIAKTSLFRVPQLSERTLPFCILISAMACYLGLSRRLELVVARSAGMSAWQFIAPALIVAMALGIFATAVFNPIAANLHERAKRLEADFSAKKGSAPTSNTGFWVRQRNADGQAIINATDSREQGALLGNVTILTFDTDGHFRERIVAQSATLEPGAWRLDNARVYAIGKPPVDRASFQLSTSLTPEQVRERFATPETVPFWQLPLYIDIANHAGLTAAGYRLQFQKLLARPFLLAAMVLLAAAFSLRFFRFGGVQQMVLGGMAAGFVLFVMSKITDDFSTAGFLNPIMAAWLPVMVGAVTGFVALLYQEDG